MRFAAEMLRHKALGSPWSIPALGEDMGIWRSHDKKQAKSAHNNGAVGRFIANGSWGNGTATLIAKGTDTQDPELVLGIFGREATQTFYDNEPGDVDTVRLLG